MEHEDEAMDLSDIMEVVAVFRCKFCSKTCSSPSEMSRHVTSTHSIKLKSRSTEETEFGQKGETVMMLSASNNSETIVLAENAVVNEIINEDQADDYDNAELLGQQEIPVHYNQEDSQILQNAMDFEAQEETTQDGLDVGLTSADGTSEQGVGTEPGSMLQFPAEDSQEPKELYLCGQCNVGYTSMELCKQHMEEDHQLTLALEAELCPDVDTEDYTATYIGENKMEVGIQACTTKRPGRKRKVVQVKEKEDAKEKDDTITKDEDDDLDDYLEKDLVLEVKRDGKRTTRPPKALMQDYYIGKKKYKERMTATAFVHKCSHSDCGAKFRSAESLKVHEVCHIKTSATKEETLKKEKENLDNGTLNPEELSPVEHSFKCQQCSMLFYEWKTCRIHMWRNHEIEVDLYHCTECSFRTDVPSKLRAHEKIHLGSKPFQCSYCNKCFKQAATLRNHEVLHLHERQELGDKWYNKKICQVCHREFANQKSLKTHIQIIHGKVKPFQCPYCDHTCARKAMMDTHIRTHTGEKPFVCELCNYSASDHNTLRRHKMRHTGYKPYTCHWCPYSCIQAISLKTHMKNKHPGQQGIFSCDKCQYRTINQKLFDGHMKDHQMGLISNFPETDTTAGNAGRKPTVRNRPAISQQTTTNVKAVNPAKNYISLQQGDQIISVPVLQVSGPGSTRQILYQALTQATKQSAPKSDTIVVQQQQQQRQQQQQHTITFQLPPSSSQSLTAASASVVPSSNMTMYTVQDGKLIPVLKKPQVIGGNQAGPSIVYLSSGATTFSTSNQTATFSSPQTAHQTVVSATPNTGTTSIDHSGLQHILTAIQSSEAGEGTAFQVINDQHQGGLVSLIDTDVAMKDETEMMHRQQHQQETVTYQVIDSSGQVINTSGQVIDSSGQVINTSGQVNDSSGQVIDSSGQVIDSSGQVIDSSGQVIDSSGQVIDSSGQVIDSSGQVIDSSGHQQDDATSMDYLQQQQPPADGTSSVIMYTSATQEGDPETMSINLQQLAEAGLVHGGQTEAAVIIDKNHDDDTS